MLSPLTLKRSRRRPSPPRPVAVAAPEVLTPSGPLRPLPAWQAGLDGRLECRWHLG